MTGDLLYPACGVLLGLALQAAGLTRREGLNGALALTSGRQVRRALYALGLGMILMALLCWLAVIDVDQLIIVPLDADVLLGGLIFGLAAGACGAVPLTMAAGVGGGRLTESVCGLAGCAAGAALAGILPQRVAAGLFTPLEGTIFRLTLWDPYLLGGAFLSLACIGLVICVLALFARVRPRRAEAEGPQKAEAAQADEAELSAEVVTIDDVTEHPGEETEKPAESVEEPTEE